MAPTALHAKPPPSLASNLLVRILLVGILHEGIHLQTPNRSKQNLELSSCAKQQRLTKASCNLSNLMVGNRPQRSSDFI